MRAHSSQILLLLLLILQLASAAPPPPPAGRITWFDPSPDLFRSWEQVECGAYSFILYMPSPPSHLYAVDAADNATVLSDLGGGWGTGNAGWKPDVEAEVVVRIKAVDAGNNEALSEKRKVVNGSGLDDNCRFTSAGSPFGAVLFILCLVGLGVGGAVFALALEEHTGRWCEALSAHVRSCVRGAERRRARTEGEEGESLAMYTAPAGWKDDEGDSHSMSTFSTLPLYEERGRV